MREFRKQVAALLTSDTALKQTSEYTIRLLLAEKGGKKNDAFLEVLDRFLTITGNTPRGRGELTTAAAKILERERASIIEGAAGWRRGRGKVANDG